MCKPIQQAKGIRPSMKTTTIAITALLTFSLALAAEEEAKAPVYDLGPTLVHFITSDELAPKVYDLEKLRPFKTPIDPTWVKEKTDLGFGYHPANDPQISLGPLAVYNKKFPDLKLFETYRTITSRGEPQGEMGPSWTYNEDPVGGKAVLKRISVYGSLTPPEEVTSSRILSGVREPTTMWLEFDDMGKLNFAVESKYDEPNQTILVTRYDDGLLSLKQSRNYKECVQTSVRVTWRHNPMAPKSAASARPIKIELEITQLTKDLWAPGVHEPNIGPVQDLSLIEFLPNGDIDCVSASSHLGAYAWIWQFPRGEGIPAIDPPYKQDRVLKREVIPNDKGDVTLGFSEAFTTDPKTGLKHGWYVRWNPTPTDWHKRVTYAETGLYLGGKRQGYWKFDNGARTVKYIDDQIQVPKD